MWHLPEQKQKVYVWPTPGLVVPSGPPHPSLVSAPIPMPAKGQVVVWDEFRHKQYLAGELQFHDPRSKEEQEKDQVDDSLLAHFHKPTYPPHLKKRLHQLADEHEAIPENAAAIVKDAKLKVFRPELTEEEAKAYAAEREARAKARAEKEARQKAEAEKKQPATPAKTDADAKKE